MTKSAAKAWKPAVLKLDQPEDGKYAFKAYAQYGTGKCAVYDLHATLNNEAVAWEHAKDLSDAYNRNAILPSQCKDRRSAAKLPAGMLLPPPPRNVAMEEALENLKRLGEDMARKRPGPQ